MFSASIKHSHSQNSLATARATFGVSGRSRSRVLEPLRFLFPHCVELILG